MVDWSIIGIGVVLCVVGVVFGYTGWKSYRQRRLVDDTETTEIRRIREEGRVELKGKIDGDVFTSPIGQEEAVLAAWEVEEWDETGNTSDWRAIASGISAEPFRIDDGTGAVRVELDDRVAGENESPLSLDRTVASEGVAVDNVSCEFADFPTVEEVDVGTEPPEHIESFVAGESGLADQSGSLTNLVDIGNAHGDRRYLERALSPGEEVYLLGHVEADADATQPIHPEDVTVTPANDEPFILSDQSEAALTDRYSSGSRRSLAVGVVLVLAGIGAVVAGMTPVV